MHMQADMIADRRQIKRRLSFWRFSAVMIAVSAATTLASYFVVETEQITFRDHIARVNIQGVIYDNPQIEALIRDVGDDPSAKALIIYVDSPGGTSSGSEGLYEAIRSVTAKKPVVAVMGSLAASGGYITSIAADHIIARGNTTTGSIGVIFQTTEFSGLMEKLGVGINEVKSGPLKAEPDMYSPMTPEVRMVTEVLIQDTHDWFVDLVAERRSLPRETALRLADGRVYTGRQAVKLELVDALGGEKEAIQWMVDDQGVEFDLPVREHSLYDRNRVFGSLTRSMSAQVMAGIMDGLGEKTVLPERLTLDGPLTLWQP